MTDPITAHARRRTALVVAVAVAAVALTVVGGATLTLGHREGPVSQPTSTGKPATGYSAARNLTTGQPPTSSPIASPPDDDLSWTTVAGARIPVSRAAGPRDTAN